MKNLIVAVIICFALSPVLLVAGSGDATAGKATYKQHCVSCHGADGAGNASVAKMMKVTIPDLGSKDVQALSDADLQKVIADGKGKMPASKGLADADLHNLVAYIRTLAKK
jgi:mono/diheme cytochrome c family protein